ncbi:RDD family protein [Gillisia sp. M10.2A]|uniref:RDD family protein n=1 Tax=Gillisia lutea TaxID=2909668 RepID=A0ABS9EK48_9FLAO|nr:RDD family protein [Gillisia lutea]MCF4101836.1 RDD family protein [Gillisia lutea]
MDKFQIETAQNIGIHQKSASVGDRILAFLVDCLILGAYAIIISLSISGMGLDGGSKWVLYLVIGLPMFLYYLLWEVFNNGQTPGKKALNIRVVKLDGARPGFSQYLIRWLLRLIDISLSSGSIAVVTILFNGKGQRLGDLAAATTVISEKTQIGISQTLVMDVPESYIPKYPQVSILKDREVQEIKNIFSSAKLQGNHNVIIALSQKIAGILQINPEERPVDFINTVLLDYNYYTQH